MDKRTIVLSAGHSSVKPGARCGDLKEHTLNLEALRALKEALEVLGVPVVTVDPSLCLGSRVAWVNEEYPTALAIELHHNAFNLRAEGAEVFYRAGDKVAFDKGARTLLLSSNAMKLKSRGMKLASASARGSLGWLKCTHALLWEVCFMDNPEDLFRVRKDSYRSWAEVVAKGLTQ